MLIRVIAVLLFVSAAILARELLHEQFNPARNRVPPSYPRATVPSFNQDDWHFVKLKVRDKGMITKSFFPVGG